MVLIGELMTDEQLDGLAVRGIPVPWQDVDALTRGLLPGSLWVIAEGAGAGRTVLACQLAAAAASADADTVLLLGRDPAGTAAANVVCARAKVPEHRLRNGGLTDDETARLRKAAGEIGSWPLRVLTPEDPRWDLSGSTSMPDMDHWLGPSTRKIADVVVSDDLDAMTDRPFPAVFALLRARARSTQETIVVTVPEERAVDGHRALPEVRREADVLIRLMRPDADGRDTARAGEADLVVLGHRQGPVATTTVAFQGHYRRFVDLAR